MATSKADTTSTATGIQSRERWILPAQRTPAVTGHAKFLLLWRAPARAGCIYLSNLVETLVGGKCGPELLGWLVLKSCQRTAHGTCSYSHMLGVEMPERLSRVVEDITDPERLAEIAETILDCDSDAERRARMGM